MNTSRRLCSELCVLLFRNPRVSICSKGVCGFSALASYLGDALLGVRHDRLLQDASERQDLVYVGRLYCRIANPHLLKTIMSTADCFVKSMVANVVTLAHKSKGYEIGLASDIPASSASR